MGMIQSDLGSSTMHDKYGPGAADPLEIKLWLRLLSCSTSIEKRLRRLFVDEHQTTLPRFDVMATLERKPEGQTMGDLSRALLVSNGNVTSIVRQLESQGLVEARPDPEDRRSSIVALSERGRQVFDELAAAHHTLVHRLFKDFPAAKQKQLLDLLADLRGSINKE